MDKKDEKLLAELTLNSRISITQLASKIGVSREVASYRMNKLKQEKIILSLYAIVNIEAMGFSRYGCYFQLKGITHKEEAKFMEYLVEHDFVTYASPVIGKWNIAFDVLAKDRNHLNKIMKELTSKASKFLESYIVISTATEQEVFPAKIFGIKNKISFDNSSKNITLDEVDLKILELLSHNSRIEYKEISKKLNLTGNAIKYRIKNLEKSKIILGYTISIDIRKLNYEWHNIQLKLKTNEKESLFIKFLKNHPRAIYFYHHFGHENWDIDVGVIARNSLELRNFIFDLRKDFGDILKIYDIYVIVEESKPNQAPKGLFKRDKENLK